MTKTLPSSQRPWKGTTTAPSVTPYKVGDCARRHLKGARRRRADAIAFFRRQKYSSKQHGSASNEWLAAISTSKKLLQEWERTKDERREFWRQLKEQEEVQESQEQLDALVVEMRRLLGETGGMLTEVSQRLERQRLERRRNAGT